MNKFLELSDSQRKSVYESVAIKVGLPAQVIEKDFWVTAILQTVFTLPVAKQLCFQGRYKFKQRMETHKTVFGRYRHCGGSYHSWCSGRRPYQKANQETAKDIVALRFRATDTHDLRRSATRGIAFVHYG